MKLKEVSTIPVPIMPEDIKEALNANKITPLKYADKNELLINEELQKEEGYTFLDDGTALVAMTCPMPGITAEMIDWWMWWHPSDSRRYQAWFPGAHISINYPKKYASYYEQESMPEFRPNVNCPKETVGAMTTHCVISFKYPRDIGINEKLLKENGFGTVVCGHVGIKGLFAHTEMIHCYKETKDGLILISRFWMGEPMKNKFLKKKLITEKLAYGMAEHCYIEYRRLVRILPKLYAEYRR